MVAMFVDDNGGGGGLEGLLAVGVVIAVVYVVPLMFRGLRAAGRWLMTPRRPVLPRAIVRS
jgi:hypothetical protein